MVQVKTRLGIEPYQQSCPLQIVFIEAGDLGRSDNASQQDGPRLCGRAKRPVDAGASAGLCARVESGGILVGALEAS